MNESTTSYRILLLLLLFYSNSNGQQLPKNRFGASFYYESGFQGKSIQLNNERINNFKSNGVNIRLSHEITIHSKFSLLSSIGYRFYAFSGKIDSGKYKGQSHKIIISENIRYRIKENFSVLAGVALINNEDFENFASKQPDLFRLELELAAQYHITTKLAASIMYSVGLSAKEQVYLTTNPLHRIQIGLQYFIR